MPPKKRSIPPTSIDVPDAKKNPMFTITSIRPPVATIPTEMIPSVGVETRSEVATRSGGVLDEIKVRIADLEEAKKYKEEAFFEEKKSAFFTEFNINSISFNHEKNMNNSTNNDANNSTNNSTNNDTNNSSNNSTNNDTNSTNNSVKYNDVYNAYNNYMAGIEQRLMNINPNLRDLYILVCKLRFQSVHNIKTVFSHIEKICHDVEDIKQTVDQIKCDKNDQKKCDTNDKKTFIEFLDLIDSSSSDQIDDIITPWITNIIRGRPGTFDKLTRIISNAIDRAPGVNVDPQNDLTLMANRIHELIDVEKYFT